MTNDIHRHFKRSEFACKCGCGFKTVDIDIIEILIRVRTTYQEKVFITSGCRCHKHNVAIKGARNSYHKQGIAVDIQMETIAPERLYNYLDGLLDGTGGLILHDTFVHLDMREEMFRQDKRGEG